MDAPSFGFGEQWRTETSRIGNHPSPNSRPQSFVNELSDLTAVSWNGVKFTSLPDDARSLMRASRKTVRTVLNLAGHIATLHRLVHLEMLQLPER